MTQPPTLLAEGSEGSPPLTTLEKAWLRKVGINQ